MELSGVIALLAFAVFYHWMNSKEEDQRDEETKKLVKEAIQETKR